MGSNGQTAPKGLSSADAGEGGGVSPHFPFVVLSGQEGASAGYDKSIFDAYVQREVNTGASAREALVAALALAAPSASERGEKVRLSSYGVTSGPFTPSAASAPLAPLPPVVSVPPIVRPVRTTRRPTLAQSTPPMPVQTVAPLSVSELETAPFPPAAPGSGPKLSLATKRTGIVRGEMPSFDQSGMMPGAAPLIPLPPSAQEAPLAPLMPISFGAPVAGGAFVPSAGTVPLTQAPFPPPAGRVGTTPPVPGLVLPGASVAAAHRPVGAAQARLPASAQKSSEWMVWLGRGAVALVVLAIIGFGRFGSDEGEFWAIRALRGVGILSPASASTGEAGGGASSAAPGTSSAGASTAGAVATPPAPVVRPAPSAEFIEEVKAYKITGVVQGESMRAIINGRLVQAGDSVDAAGGVRLIGLDTDGRRLIFEDSTAARVALRY
jgi:hypothetical protein